MFLYTFNSFTAFLDETTKKNRMLGARPVDVTVAVCVISNWQCKKIILTAQFIRGPESIQPRPELRFFAVIYGGGLILSRINNDS